MSEAEITATLRFQEKCEELEGLLAQFDHDAWKRGLPTLDKPANDSDEHADMPARKSVRLLAGAILRATELRLRTLAAMAGHLSENERQSLTTLLRLPASERRTIAALLRLPEQEREQLATALCLSDPECRALGAFVCDGASRQDDQTAAAETGRPRPARTKQLPTTGDEI